MKMKIKEKWHYTAAYILNPQHPITINVIGAGGTGSRMLTELARIDHSLKQLGHPGLYVTCYDGDIVTEANLGRQLFSAADLGLNKAVVFITRINQFMGTNWKAVPENYKKGTVKRDDLSNFTITCVDTIEARKQVNESLIRTYQQWNNDPYARPYYWLDLGNTQNSGQFIIGTVNHLSMFDQPNSSATLDPIGDLPTIFQKYPDFEHQKTKDMGPSCSLAEALTKQDLFINSTLVNLAAGMLWKMFRQGRINYQGAFLNLQTMDVAKINL